MPPLPPSSSPSPIEMPWLTGAPSSFEAPYYPPFGDPCNAGTSSVTLFVISVCIAVPQATQTNSANSVFTKDNFSRHNKRTSAASLPFSKLFPKPQPRLKPPDCTANSSCFLEKPTSAKKIGSLYHAMAAEPRDIVSTQYKNRRRV